MYCLGQIIIYIYLKYQHIIHIIHIELCKCDLLKATADKAPDEDRTGPVRGHLLVNMKCATNCASPLHNCTSPHQIYQPHYNTGNIHLIKRITTTVSLSAHNYRTPTHVSILTVFFAGAISRFLWRI